MAKLVTLAGGEAPDYPAVQCTVYPQPPTNTAVQLVGKVP